MNCLKQTLLVSTAALLLTGLSFAQSEADQHYSSSDADQHYRSSEADQQFMSEAAQAGMAKINFAYLALQNAQNEQVKAYARRILNDYGQAQSDLIYVANQQGVILPKTLNASDAETLDALSQLHGAAFDKAFMQTMVKGDETGVSSLQHQATKLDNPVIMKWASNTLPTLQGTLNQAQKVAPAVGIHPKGTNEEQGKAKNEQQAAPNAGESSDAAQQKTDEQSAPKAKPSDTAAPKYQQY